jgi:hypothetical protein
MRLTKLQAMKSLLTLLLTLLLLAVQSLPLTQQRVVASKDTACSCCASGQCQCVRCEEAPEPVPLQPSTPVLELQKLMPPLVLAHGPVLQQRLWHSTDVAPEVNVAFPESPRASPVALRVRLCRFQV